MMLNQVHVVRLLQLLLITGIISSYLTAVDCISAGPRVGGLMTPRFAEVGRKSSWQTLGSRMTDRYAIPSKLKSNCDKRYSFTRCLLKSKYVSVCKALDTKKSNSVIVKVFKERLIYDRESMAFDRLAARKKIYEAERSESSAATASSDTSPWNHFVQLQDRCLLYGYPALVIEYLDQVLTDTIKLVPMTITPPASSSNAACEETGAATSSACARSPRPNMIYNPARYFKWYTYQLLVAVDTLHEAGMAHFDLKPSNMGLTHDATLKLFDFETVSSFVPHVYIGTLEYSAPEMNAGVKIAHGDKMDVWSIGCTIFEIFTGERLFPRIRAFAEFTRGSSLDAPHRKCEKRAAYFYIIWSFGLSTFEDYEEPEEQARTLCPQIFADRSLRMLRKSSPRVLAYAYSQTSRVTTEIEHQWERFSGYELYPGFEASETEPSDVFSLLNRMILMDDRSRSSLHFLHTEHEMFYEYRN